MTHVEQYLQIFLEWFGGRREMTHNLFNFILSCCSKPKEEGRGEAKVGDQAGGLIGRGGGTGAEAQSSGGARRKGRRGKKERKKKRRGERKKRDGRRQEEEERDYIYTHTQYYIKVYIH